MFKTYTADGREKTKGQTYAPQGVVCSVSGNNNGVAYTANNYTIVPMGSKEFDPFAAWDSVNHRFQPKIPGYYSIIAEGGFTFGVADQATVRVNLWKNGVSYKALGLNQSGASNNLDLFFPVLVYLNGTTDYLDVRIYNNTTSGTGFFGSFQAALAASSVGVAPEPTHYVGAAGEPAFQNGWVAEGSGYTQPGFYKDPNGIVHLTGHVNGTSATASTAFTLPAGYRPKAAILFGSKYYLGAAASFTPGELAVQPTGPVNLTKADESPALTARWYVLDGATFRAEQ